MSKTLKIFLSLVVIAFAGLVYWAVVTAPDPPPVGLTKDEPPIMTFSGNTLFSERDGKKAWDLTAETMSMDVTTKDARLENIIGHFYGENDLVVEVKAPKGVYTDKTKDISLEDEVTLTASDGSKLTAKTLTWTQETGMLAAEGDVRMKHEDMRGSCDRLEITELFNHYKMIGKAHLEEGVKDDDEQKK